MRLPTGIFVATRGQYELTYGDLGYPKFGFNQGWTGSGPTLGTGPIHFACFPKFVVH